MTLCSRYIEHVQQHVNDVTVDNDGLDIPNNSEFNSTDLNPGGTQPNSSGERTSVNSAFSPKNVKSSDHGSFARMARKKLDKKGHKRNDSAMTHLSLISNPLSSLGTNDDRKNWQAIVKEDQSRVLSPCSISSTDGPVDRTIGGPSQLELNRKRMERSVSNDRTLAWVKETCTDAV